MIEQSTTADARKGSLAIQYLRGVAALMVVFYHVALHLNEAPAVKARYLFLSAGVDVFFVISGFVMWLSTTRKPQSPAFFFENRIKRILPLYWIMSGVTVALLLVLPGAFNSSRFELGHVVKSFLFFPARHPVQGAWEPVLFAGWTLNYEMAFYLVFSVALLIRRNFRIAFVTAVFAGLVVANAVLHDVNSLLDFYGASIVFEFTFGMLVGAVYTDLPAISRRQSVALLALGLALFAIPQLVHFKTWRVLQWGLPAMFVVGGAALYEKTARLKFHPVAALIGDASYSIYLAHGMIVAATAFAVHRLHFLGRLEPWVFSIAAVAGSIIGGLVLYKLVEQPLVRHLGRKARRPDRSVATPPAGL